MEAGTLRILHVYKNYAPTVGGIENHIKMLAEAEAAHGHEVTVLVSHTSALTSCETLNGVQVIRAARAVEVASTPLSIAMMFEAVALAPDVVNLHMPFPPGDIVARAVRGDPPVVASYHSDVVRQQRLLRIYRPVLERTLARAERIIVSSAAYRDSSPFLSLHRDKCRVVPYGVDATRFATVDLTEIERLRSTWPGPIILSVGVLRYYKGLHILIPALRDVPGSLVLVGEGPEAARLRALAQEHGVADRVFFAGRVSDEDLPAYYQSADVFVLASHLRAEAFGIVLLEAMAAGLPLVTTEIGTATSEINRHGETGFVVPPNAPHILARALKVLLADRGLREYLGQNGRRRATRDYTPARMAEQTMAIYDEALALRRRFF